MAKKKVVDSPGTSLGTRSSNRLKWKATAAQMIAPTVEKANKSPRKRGKTKKNVEDVVKSKGVASKRGRYGKSKKGDGAENDEGTDSAGTSKVVRSSSRLKMKANSEIKADEKGKGKRKQAPEDTNLELMKSPQKKRKIGKETLTKKKVDDLKKSSGVASKRDRYGKSKSGVEKTDSAGSSKVLRSSIRLKGKAKADDRGKGEEKVQRRTRKKPENPTISKSVAPKKVGRSKSNRADSAGNDKEKTDSAGTSKASRSASRLKEKANADTKSNEDQRKRKRAPRARALEMDKTPQLRTKKKSEGQQKYMDLGSGKVSHGRPKRKESAGGDKKRSDSAGPSRVSRSSSRGKGKANADENDKGEKRKVSKKIVTDIVEKKGVKAKVEKRKMPDRMLRSNSKTKK